MYYTSAQRGFVVPMILFGVLTLVSGIGLLLFYLFYPKPVVTPTSSIHLEPNASVSANEQITDFESCRKAGYPVQESFPRKCSSNGESFTEEVVNATASPNVTFTKEGWKLYTNTVDGYSISYPINTFTKCGSDEFFLFEGAEGTRACDLGEEPTMFYITTRENSKHYQVSSYEQCYTVTKESIMIAGVQANKYYATVKSRTGECGLTEVAYADSHIHIDLTYKGKNYEIAYYNNSDQQVSEEMLASFKFTN
jgi:hypothetical protein